MQCREGGHVGYMFVQVDDKCMLQDVAYRYSCYLCIFNVTAVLMQALEGCDEVSNFSVLT